MLKIFKVSGTSMEPTLVSGDFVLATSLFKGILKKNKIIVFFNNSNSFIIKRVLKREKCKIFLKSDNAKTDSIFCNAPLDINRNIYTVFLKIRLNVLKNKINLGQK
ncbi:MAG: hypothetical protein CMP24_05110 [Rickettsiales bacterium]|nr:hypothetical protein [Rickettsiales bacterium]|tara:strand:- start:283 stop:600 length:318 start_codon:yes stop_codon:yes gene_type:complete